MQEEGAVVTIAARNSQLFQSVSCNSAKEPGLSKVYDSILGFEGDEFYMQAWPELTGES